jgi:hypothetical protein
VVGGEFGVEGADAPGQPDGLGAADGQGVVVAAGAPGRDGRDRRGGQGAAGVNAEVDGAQQRGQRVDRAGALAAHLLAGDCQDSQGGPIAGRPRPAQLVDVQAASGLGDRDGVHGVALAAAPAGGGRDIGCLRDGQAGFEELLGEGGAVGSGAVDDDQRRRLLCVALDPADGPAQPCWADRKLGLLPDHAGASGDQGQGVGCGVGPDQRGRRRPHRRPRRRCRIKNGQNEQCNECGHWTEEEVQGRPSGLVRR